MHWLTIFSTLKHDNYENAQRVAREAIEKWRKSGNDPADFARIHMVWQSPEGDTAARPLGKLAPDW
ncbi:hypothetical protein [Natronorubrum sulfidifaciens]|uniref:Uncharacterized protein n=1 Tax=Natronorubrum sulfidifaciens JCM 14089 TaxID=1230460 RepID=L9WDH4_9EURY|nr:hypothetical protein [Natronorubrum sulfidifaciens]ELY47520.1 hypothetical protein C495_04652 [Natronorubrum sulfidifaciens JCM 14089]